MEKINNESIKEKYENLRVTIIALVIILLIIIALFVLALYKGWFGEPGRIYFGPKENGYYLKCRLENNVCGINQVCEEVSIVERNNNLIKDSLCLDKEK